jgi:cytochrome c oxidase cbb3-type subunit 1
VQASYPGYVVRLLGGGLFFVGMLVMGWNTWKTVSPVAPERALQTQPA